MVKVLLIVVQGKPEGKTIPITGPVFRVGRGVDCHLRPNSEEVSRAHTEITLSETEAVVRDLGSRNGTWVNGQLLKAPHKLSSGELLKIGPLTFAVAIQGSSEDAASAPVPPPATTGARVRALDEIPAGQIDAWLVSDQTKPTPERPSGVYSGDTLTLESFRQSKGSSASIPVTPPAPVISPLEAHIEGIEMLPEGMGDGVDEPTNEDTEAKRPDDQSEEDEMIDESNPFHAKKAAAPTPASAAKAEAAKPASAKDSSEAANDILKKMLDRRRPSR